MADGRKAKGKADPHGGETHAQGFNRALDDALRDAADSWGTGSRQAHVRFEVDVVITNPGRVAEYRIILEETT